MTEVPLPALVSAAAVLVLAGAALVRYRLPTRRVWWLAGLWIGTIALAWAAATLGLNAGLLTFT